MFQRNDVVVYGGHGVCQIVDVEDKTIDSVNKTYFVLRNL